jgi:saccharopine dehydrogenase-like NADP-dependent oxidoreductase
VKIVVLGGAGAMGQVIVRDLAEAKAVQEIVIADVSLERANDLKKLVGSDKVKAVHADINSAGSLSQAFSKADVVVNSTPYVFNVQVMEACLEAGCHYLDLGGLFHVTRKQLELNEKFKAKSLLAVVGMGAAPGMTNVMAAHGANQLDEVEAIDMVVAGVDFVKHNHPLLPPYALETILDEYAMEPWVFEDGKFKAKPPMSGEMTADMPPPVNDVKAFLTLHSEIATLPLTYEKKGIKQCSYRLGLPEEFHERMKFVVELGFGAKEDIKLGGASVNPRKVLAHMIASHPVPTADPDDCETVRVDVKGKAGGRPALVRLESTIFCHKRWKVSCGALDTGVPPSIVAQMIGSGSITARGVLPPEQCVPPEPFFDELAKREIVVRMITDQVVVGQPARKPAAARA